MSDTEPQMQPDDAGDADSGRGRFEREPGKPATVTDIQKNKNKTRRGHLPRRISAWVLVVLASILIPVSVLSVWAINTVTNTDKYVETMAPLARNPVIVDGLATRATDALFSTHIVQNKVTARAPEVGEAARCADRESGALLRVRPGAQGLLEPEVRRSCGTRSTGTVTRPWSMSSPASRHRCRRNSKRGDRSRSTCRLHSTISSMTRTPTA